MYSYTVSLVNFGNVVIYHGSDFATALGKAEKAGFETTLRIEYNDAPHGEGVSYRHYSPINGWH